VIWKHAMVRVSRAMVRVSRTIPSGAWFWEHKKKAGRLESHLLWSFYDRSHEKTVYDKPD